MSTSLALYLHLPWCIQKCPYCDFNSHALKATLPEQDYLNALINQIEHERARMEKRPIISLFIGGGTPSLFSTNSIEQILTHIDGITSLKTAEITMEANPGTFEIAKFKAYKDAGITRLSLGIQSFNDQHLKALGRIHNGGQSQRALDHAMQIGFDHLNCDLMFALPNQTEKQALNDLTCALEYNPHHLSYYQLTLEPNTPFYRKPPSLPQHDTTLNMMQNAQALIAKHGYEHYEVSAYAQPHHRCVHNEHIWRFGDYLGMGAGAHSKIGTTRWMSPKHPKAYIQAPTTRTEIKALSQEDLIFEYMLNHLRLQCPIYFQHFNQQTNLNPTLLQQPLNQAQQMDWIVQDEEGFTPTAKGRLWLDDLTSLFLPSERSS